MEGVLPLPSSALGSSVVSCVEAPGDHLTYLTHTNGRELSQAACTASSLTLRVPRDALLTQPDLRGPRGQPAPAPPPPGVLL